MNEKQIKEKMLETFETEVPDVLSKIKASPQFYVPKKEKKSFGFKNLLNKKMALSFMSVFVIALIVVSMIGRNTDPVVASTVTLDVNPSIQITLDEDDIVINVTTLNNDGDEVINKNIKYLGMTLDEVLEILVERLNELGYIVTSDDVNNIILIEVDSDNEAIKTRIEAVLQTKLKMEMTKYGQSNWVLNSDDIQLNDEDRAAINQNPLMQRMTKAKLSLIYRIHQLDNTYLLDDLKDLTVRELYSLFIELENPDNLPNYNEMPGRKKPNHNMPGN